MRGDERVQDSMFSYMTLEQRVPADHPLREIRILTDGVQIEECPGGITSPYGVFRDRSSERDSTHTQRVTRPNTANMEAAQFRASRPGVYVYSGQ